MQNDEKFKRICCQANFVRCFYKYIIAHFGQYYKSYNKIFTNLFLLAYNIKAVYRLHKKRRIFYGDFL